MHLVNTPIYEDFTVTDGDHDKILDLVEGDFATNIYNPSGNDVSGVVGLTITEMASGSYRASFTPDVTGIWYIVVFHPTYFPWGKSNNIFVTNEDIDTVPVSVWTDSTAINLIDNIDLIRDIEIGRWKLDRSTNQMIFYADDNETEVARFNLYNEAGAPSVDDVFQRIRV